MKIPVCPHCGGSGSLVGVEELMGVVEGLGRTDKERAERIGVSLGYMSMLRRGKRRMSGRVVRRVMEVVGFGGGLTNSEVNDEI